MSVMIPPFYTGLSVRPRAIAVTTVLMCLTNFCGFFLINWKLRSAPVFFAVFTLFIVAGYVVLYFFWKGRNWARWMVLLTCFLCFWNLWGLSVPVAAKYYSPFRTPMVLVEGMIAVYLVIYLNTPRGRSFFIKQPQTAQVDGSLANGSGRV